MIDKWNWIKDKLKNYWHVIVTFMWLIFVGYKGYNGVIPNDLNEFGDFIAGVVAPLAFLWLVKGFYQQGKGLEQNSEALRMQAKELEKTTEALTLQVDEMKASVEQQTRLAQVYEEELQQKHFQVSPNLDYSFQLVREFFRTEYDADEDGKEITYEEKVIELKLSIKNLGEIARNLQVNSTAYPYTRKNESKFDYLGTLEITFEINGQAAEKMKAQEIHMDFLFEVTYQNMYGKKYRDHLTCAVISEFDINQIYLHSNLQRLHTVIS